MRRRVSVLLLVTVLASLLATASAPVAAAPKNPLKCKTQELEGKSFRHCSGFVRTKDKSAVLDTDVTLPGKGKGPFPVIVMMHGLGGDKNSFQVDFEGEDGFDPSSDTIEGTGGKYRYNNAWFASRGYAVLTYTARGWHDSECKNDSKMSSDAAPEYPDSPACQMQLAHKDYEVKDTQYLIGKLVDRTLLRADVAVNRKRVGATGISYGGGQTWLLSRDSKWRSPAGKAIKLRVAAPIIGWTDLVDALVPNGVIHEGWMPPALLEDRLAEPTGVVKKSYIDRFWTGMNIYAADQGDLPEYLETWRERILDGEPYDDPIVDAAFGSFIANRSAYWVPQDSVVPTVSIQGWTDHIFPAIQSVQMAERLRAEDPNYPVKVLLNDFGHPIAQNPSEHVQYGANLVNQWFDHYLKGKGSVPMTGYETLETRCADMGDQESDSFNAGSFGALQAGFERYELDLEGTLDTSVVDPDAAALDPFPISSVSGCRYGDPAVPDGNLAVSIELPDGFEMLGIPTVLLQADAGAPDMHIAFRLWDVSADGTKQALVDRGVFRLGDAGPQEVFAQLQGNAYDFLPGHSLSLELTAKDHPSYRASNSEGSIGVSGAELYVPRANPDAEVEG